MQYDYFQKQSIRYISEGHSVLVSAPTGAGKTVIAEHVILECLKQGSKAVYTAPIKALSNQKFRDFQKIYPDKIGIITGDVSINSHAPILIMTTEIFRNKILSEAGSLNDYSWVIFDEIHYLDNYERGTVWEESLIFLPKHMNILGLSATIPNIEEFADWIRHVHNKSLKVVIEPTRPVPLHFLFQAENTIADHIKKLKSFWAKRRYVYHGRKKMIKGQRPNRLSSLVKDLLLNDRLPCIYFAFGRRRCEYLAEEMHGFDFLDQDQKRNISVLFNDLCEKFSINGETSVEKIRPLVKQGIAYHHAGMLPTLKEVIERLFTAKLLKLIFTTETFALGINMPAKTVIFDELRKFYGKHFANLKTRDFYQMAGRAGRRGIDTEGFVYSRINLSRIDYKELNRIIYNPPERVVSRFNASYATLLNLYAQYGEHIYDIYPNSFHWFQERKKYRERALNDMRTKITLLDDMGYIGNEELTEKGVFAGKIYGYELPVTEMHEKGFLDYLSPSELAIVFAALVFEPRKNTHKPSFNKNTRKLGKMTDDIVWHIHSKEKKHKVWDRSKDFYYHLSPTIDAWINGMEFNKLLDLTDIDEGEIIRNFRMCIQVLRELLDTTGDKAFKNKILDTIRMINRDVIDAEKQLREL